MSARAQAGLEYLMTYGWALVLIAALVGVLVFIFTPPQEGIVFSSDSREFVVVSGKVEPEAGSDSVTLILRNLSGDANITSVLFTGDFSDSGSNLSLNNESTLPVEVGAGEEMLFENIDASSKYEIEGTIIISYNNAFGLPKTVVITGKGWTGTTSSASGGCSKIENETRETCYDTITAALAAAETVNGDVIVIQDSDNYNEGTITINKGITLKGKPGFPKPLIDGGGSLSSAIIIDADNVRLENLRVANATGDIIKQNNPHSGTMITDLEAYNSTGDECIQLKKCTNCMINNVVAHDCVGGGLNISDNSSSSSIVNSEVYNSSSSNWGVIYLYNSSGITISNNYVHDNSSNIGIYLSKLLGNNIVSRNTIEDNSFVTGEVPPDGIGILVSYFEHDPDTELTNGTFSIGENTIINNTGSGIQVTLTTIDGKTYNPEVSGTPTISIGNNNVYGNSSNEVYNSSPWDITATSNWWNTVSCAAIEAEVYHSDDSSAVGTVDFDPVLNASYPGGALTHCT